jgi:hypothetical protein
MELDDKEEDIICYKKDPNRDDWKIALPDSMVNEVVRWFHTVLSSWTYQNERYTASQVS